MAAGQHLFPIRVVIGSITVALAKALLQGGGADGIQRLLFLQRFIAKHQIAGLEPCLEMSVELFRVEPHQYLRRLSWIRIRSADCSSIS